MAKVLGMPMAELWLQKRTSRGNLMNSIQPVLQKLYVSIGKHDNTQGRFSFEKPFYYAIRVFTIEH